MKTAIITGIRGQDGSYLSELLLDKGYKVVGLERRSSSPDYSNIEHLFDNNNFIIEQGDVTDFGSVARVLKQYKPQEFYNLAAQSFVAASWDQAVATCDINFTGPCNCMEAIRLVSPETKFFQASTSEVYGDVITSKQNESTPARPRSPYAAAKYGAESLVKVYRESYNMFACYARSFNHESPRRGKQFVTRKITSAIGDMVKEVTNHYWAEELMNYGTILPEALVVDQIINPIRLGNIDAKRDWSHAKDIVRGMWLMLQQDTPDDYVFASGTTRSIRDFLSCAFECVGIHDWSSFVFIDPKLFRPAEVNLLCGDATKAREKLGWEPEISFESLVQEMMIADTSALALQNIGVNNESKRGL